MKTSAITKLALKVAIVGIAAVAVAVAVYTLKHQNQTGVAPHKLFHKNPLLGHEEEVFKLLYKRDMPDKNKPSTWASEQKYYFNINSFLYCTMTKEGNEAMKKMPKNYQKAFWKDCAHMARIEMQFAKSQGKFMNSTVNDWLDQRLLKILFHKQQAKLHYENTH